MKGGKKYNRRVRNFLLFVASFCSGILLYLNAYDWYYVHGHLHEPFGHHEIIAALSILLLIGMVWLVFHLDKQATFEIAYRIKAEEALSQLNLESEKRVTQRTAQLLTELEERKKAEKKLVEYQVQLRSLSSELSLVEERERHRIANDLHDNIGHTLAIVNNQLGILKASISSNQGKELLDDIKDLVKESIRYSRSLIFELSSPLFYDLSFTAAVEWLAEDILKKNGIDVHLKFDEDAVNLADAPRVLFLKAIREILVNVIKHAKAQIVEVCIRTEADDIIVEIKDDGIGFDVPAVPRISPTSRQGLGIFTIRERLSHLDGHFSIASKPGQGTCVTLTMPIQKEAAEENS